MSSRYTDSADRSPNPRSNGKKPLSAKRRDGPSSSRKPREPSDDFADAAFDTIARAKATPDDAPDEQTLGMLTVMSPRDLAQHRALSTNLIKQRLQWIRESANALEQSDEDIVLSFRQQMRDRIRAYSSGIERDKVTLAWIERKLGDPKYLQHWEDHCTRQARSAFEVGRATFKGTTPSVEEIRKLFVNLNMNTKGSSHE